MRILTALAAICLIAVTTPAQSGRRSAIPSRFELWSAQHEVLYILASLVYSEHITAEELDSAGRVVKRKSFSYPRVVRLDNGTPYVGVAQASVKLKHARLTRMDATARFMPVFIAKSSSLTFVGREGGLYLFEVTGPYFTGKLWTLRQGHILKAEGVPVFADPQEGEKPLRFTYRANPETFLPESVEIDDQIPLLDKNGREVGSARVRVLTRFVEYRKFRSEAKVLEMGDAEP